MDEPLVSIIVPTYNSGKHLRRLLASIEKQTYSNIETIIVDAYSNDDTVDIAGEYGAKVYLLRSERARAKNFGTRVAQGKYVLYLDSDMELTPRVVEEAVKLAQSRPRIGGVIIPEITAGDNLLAKLRNYERRFYVNTPIESARFFPRQLALRVGGYDEDLVFYEEATLPHKIEQLGYDVRARIKSYIIHHEEDLTLPKLLRKKYYYAKTAKLYLSRYSDRHSVKIQVNPIYRYKILITNIRFWKKPHLALAVLALKTLEYAAATLGYILGMRSTTSTHASIRLREGIT